MSEVRRQPAHAGAAVLEPERLSPFLHDRGDVLYNPLTGVSLPKAGAGVPRAFRRGGRLPRRTGTRESSPTCARPGSSSTTSKRSPGAATCSSSPWRPAPSATTAARSARSPWIRGSARSWTRGSSSRSWTRCGAVGGEQVVVFLSNYNEPTVDPLFEQRVQAPLRPRLPGQHPDQRLPVHPRALRAPRSHGALPLHRHQPSRRWTRTGTSSSTARGICRG